MKKMRETGSQSKSNILVYCQNNTMFNKPEVPLQNWNSRQVDNESCIDQTNQSAQTTHTRLGITKWLVIKY